MEAVATGEGDAVRAPTPGRGRPQRAQKPSGAWAMMLDCFPSSAARRRSAPYQTAGLSASGYLGSVLIHHPIGTSAAAS
jgi:hypothetical protein